MLGLIGDGSFQVQCGRDGGTLVVKGVMWLLCENAEMASRKSGFMVFDAM